ncbi:hypothetical protein Bca101_023498 [Brassica carinata]
MELPKKSNLPAPPQPSRTSFSSLPEGIVLSILARISTSHYPKLSLVSRSFRSLIPSKDLKLARSRHKTKENRVYVCLQSHIHPCNHRWFSLWIKPDDHQTLTLPCDDRWVGFWRDPDQHQTLACCMSGDKTTRNLLVPIPSSYSPYLPVLYETAGSDKYAIGDGLNPSSSTTVRVCNELVGEWREAPSMMVARKNAFTCSLNGKIYVMGGCESDESECWAEVENTWYCYANGLHWRHDTKYCKEWRLVKEMLDDFPLTSEIFFSEIWCAVVLLERRHDDEVWGQIEWVDLVLRVPSSHTLLRCVELMQAENLGHADLVEEASLGDGGCKDFEDHWNQRYGENNLCLRCALDIELSRQLGAWAKVLHGVEGFV